MNNFVNFLNKMNDFLKISNGNGDPKPKRGR